MGSYWTVIITLFGWLGIIKAVWLIILPNTVAKLTEVYQKSVTPLVVQLVIALAVGVFLTVMEYFIA